MVSYTIEDADGGAALDENMQQYRGDGYGVVDPEGGDLEVTIDSGTLGGASTLSVAAGDAYTAGTTHSVSSQSVSISGANPTDPRRDVVYVDSSGNIQVEDGTPEARDPEEGSLSRFEHFRPAPADLASTPAVVLAEVWVPAGVATISGADLRDRRTRALDVDSLVDDVATQSDLHTRYTNEEARDAAGAMATDGLVYDDANDELGLNVVASGPETLSSGEFLVDLGEPVTNGAGYSIFFGDSDGAKVAGEKTETGGNHAINIVETSTSVDNPTVEFWIVRFG
ncbi:hypothetical protein C2R22_05885 [Salinigranum rubrum]|uniref:Uncharacterized protein n=1 Tax=Salinigranum rubrum TaxID=755307 RepID=A0A2I8VH47_9EURY|nr:hypothetical protein [Salinigranum rubrum]AUV81248.1 hypothetical protein C2R22_05885 [Salinigranum rubrum]